MLYLLRLQALPSLILILFRLITSVIIRNALSYFTYTSLALHVWALDRCPLPLLSDTCCPSREFQDLSGSVLFAQLIRPMLSPTLASEDIHQIFGWSLDDARGKTLSVGPLATPKAFRLIDCNAYHNNIIQIIEFHSLNASKRVPYHAISYVWKGNQKSPISASFTVEGAEDSGRIDIDLLRMVCVGKDYLWLDQLCIMQTDFRDKAWQIQNMPTIYKDCKAGLVLPGGIGGLPGLDERTSWLDRSWTLQEALFPPRIFVIFKWTRGPGILLTKHAIVRLDDGYDEMSLEILLQLGSNSTRFVPSTGKPGEDIQFNIFSKVSTQPLLRCAMLGGHQSMNEGMGGIYMDTSGKEPANVQWHGIEEVPGVEIVNEFETMVWRSAMVRTSTRDLDTVFSIMGLFDVELDPFGYSTQSQALIALVQKTMENGGRATWLAASIITPGILPLLPVATVQDVPSIETPSGMVEAHFLIDGLDWYLQGAPKGSLDDTGALTIIAPFSPLEAIVSSLELEDHYGARLGITTTMGPIYVSGSTGTHAVLLGTRVWGLTPNPSSRHDNQSIVLLMLLKPMDNKWCKVGMAFMPKVLTEDWEEKQVIIVGKDGDGLYS